jgi:predicted aspartyl protease
MRPLVRIAVAGYSDPLIAYIDTGFNGAIIVDAIQAERLGFRISENQFAHARLASQRRESFWLAQGRLRWFDEQVLITAYVLIETDEERSDRLARKTEEEVLIGTELLSGCRMEIDFPGRTVLLRKIA